MLAYVHLLIAAGFSIEADQAVEESVARVLANKIAMLARQTGVTGVPGRKFADRCGIECRHF